MAIDLKRTSVRLVTPAEQLELDLHEMYGRCRTQVADHVNAVIKSLCLNYRVYHGVVRFGPLTGLRMHSIIRAT